MAKRWKERAEVDGAELVGSLDFTQCVTESLGCLQVSPWKMASGARGEVETGTLARKICLGGF